MTDEKRRLTACQTPIGEAADGQEKAHHMSTR
jgi:hypothetical protein